MKNLQTNFKMRLHGFVFACLVYGCTATINQLLKARMEARQRLMQEEWSNAEKQRDTTRMDDLLIKLLETDAYKDLTPQGTEEARRVIQTPPKSAPPMDGANGPVFPESGHRGRPGPGGERGPEPAWTTRRPSPTITWRTALSFDPGEEKDIFEALEDPDEAERYVTDAWATQPTVAAAETDSPFRRGEMGNKGVFGAAGAPVPRNRPIQGAHGVRGSSRFLGGPSGARGAVRPPTGPGNGNSVDDGGKMTPEKKAKKLLETLDEKGTKLNDLPVRKEYRCMSSAERRKFHDAINQLKQQRVGNSNAYDTFVVFHNKVFAPGAYQGPGFLPWHRHFLWLFEKALRAVSKDDSITLPYWDSSADADLPNPLTSALWRDTHMGTSRGNVVDGPFANWITASGLPLERQVSGDTVLLYNQEMFNYILAQNDYGGVVDVLELTHTGPHSYVGGQMEKFSSSVMDPLFFMHLAFVDCLWEEWRENEQYANSIDPEGDYPVDSDLPVPHKITSQMRPFEITNKAGLARVYTSLYYKYQPRNSCPGDKCGCDKYGRDCVDVLDDALNRHMANAPAWMRAIFTAVPDASRDTCT